MIAIALLAALPLMPVAERAPQPSSADVTHAAYPDADYVTLDDRTYVEYAPDGTFTQWNDEWILALREKGRRALRTVSVDVSRRYGDAEIQTVEIVGTNGVLRKVDVAKTLKEATDNSSMGMNIYDPLDRVIACGAPDLRVGEIRHVTTCRRTVRPFMRDAFATSQLLEHRQPIRRMSLAVEAPPERPLKSAKLCHPLSNTVERLPMRALPGGRTRHEWVARDVPQLFPEPDMPGLVAVAQCAFVSTCRDWEEVSRWYWNLCAPHLARTDAAMTNKVEALVKGLSSKRERVRAIFKFVSQEVRYMGLTLEDESPGFAPHDVSLTFGNRYGVCRDKAALLVAMLRIAGFEAYPVLIRVGPKLDPDVPTPFFNHAITWCEGELMDCTAESTKDLFPAYLMNRSYLVAHPVGRRLETSPVQPADENALRIVSEGSLNEDGSAVLEVKMSFAGVNDNAYRGALLRMTPRERRKFFGTRAQGLSEGAELLSFEIKPSDLRDTDAPLEAKFTLKLPDLVQRGDTRDELRPPLLSPGFGAVNALLDDNTSLEQRRFPLVVFTTAQVDETLELKLGDALGAPADIPPPVDFAVGGFLHERAYAVSNGAFRARRRMTVEALEFSPEEYLKLREAKKEIETAARPRPLFAVRDSAREAHVRTLVSATDCTLLSANSWVLTRETEEEVLDYQGKKSSAERKFPYNPALGGVEVLTATVSNRDGRVYAATAREMNVMDQGWVASAPRYPAGKILVVNLPSVETGSVIRLVTRTTVTNSPLPWTALAVFDSTEPVRRRSYTVHGCPFTFVRSGGEPQTAESWTRTVVDPDLLPDERGTPPAILWRDAALFSAGGFAEFGAAFEAQAAAARAAGSGCARAWARELVEKAGARTPEEKIRAVRDALFRRVRLAGPGLTDLPFDRAFTPPDVALADGYASVLDWHNLYRTMLEEVGFSVEFALLDSDRGGLEVMRSLRRVVPQPDDFADFVLRASIRTGCWPFAGRRTFWLDYENDYTPVGVRDSAGQTAYFPARDAFEELEDPRELDSERFTRVLLRENGSADFIVSNRFWGVSVGGFRKQFTELLPELRARFFQEMLGLIADNATATRELETDVEAYPFVMTFEAHVPGYATLQGDLLSAPVPGMGRTAYGPDEERRICPICLRAGGRARQIYEYVFPEGFDEVERRPGSWEVELPGGDGPEDAFRVTTRTEDGRLVVRLEHEESRARDVLLTPDYAGLLRGWNLRIMSAADRRVVVRRGAANSVR